MRLIRHKSDLSAVDHADIRNLIAGRIEGVEAEGSYEWEVHGQFVVADSGDVLPELESETFSPLLGDPPCHELLLDHGDFYEMVWILSGDQGVTLVVPKCAGIPAELLALCAKYAEAQDASFVVQSSEDREGGGGKA